MSEDYCLDIRLAEKANDDGDDGAGALKRLQDIVVIVLASFAGIVLLGGCYLCSLSLYFKHRGKYEDTQTKYTNKEEEAQAYFDRMCANSVQRTVPRTRYYTSEIHDDELAQVHSGKDENVAETVSTLEPAADAATQSPAPTPSSTGEIKGASDMGNLQPPNRPKRQSSSAGGKRRSSGVGSKQARRSVTAGGKRKSQK